MFRSSLGLIVGIAFTSVMVACSGTVGEPGSTGDLGGDGQAGAPGAAAMCLGVSPGSSPLRRLTRREYNLTIQALLGDQTAPASKFVPEARQFGFDNNVEGATLNSLLIEQHEDAATKLANNAVKDLPKLLGCDFTSKGEDVCARQFIETFGRKAYRRPLMPADVERYMAFYAGLKQTSSFTEAIELTTRAFLLSPWFLYRPEFGTPDPKSPGAVRLTGYEMASRLSYLFWGSMPDDELFAAAAKGELTTSSQVLAQAKRLLTDAKGERAVADFYNQWATLSQLDALDRGTAFSPQLATLQRQETEAFVNEVVRNGDGRWSTMLTAPFTFTNATLAAHYGIAGGTTGAALRKISLDAKRGGGLMAQGSLMTLLAHPGQTSPVLRGKFVREQLLCEAPLVPPNNVDTTVPAPDLSLTARQQLEMKTESVQPCKTCHALLNPVGYAFDHFDSTGRWRDKEESGLPIDTTGDLVGTDVDGPISDHIGLLAKLADSRQARDCVVTQWFRYAHGREQAEADGCVIAQITELFESSGGNVRELLIGLTQTDAFLFRTAPQGGQ